MSEKPTSGGTSVADILNVQDEKIGKVVEEVDRFFRSVHADIEDWKFAMEDEGDGTRIFVRLQIHLRTSGASSRPGKSKARRRDQGEVTLRHDDLTGGEEPPSVQVQVDTSGREVPQKLEVATRSDPDLAPIVEEWKRKRESGPRVEFHKAGAPLLDAVPERKSSKRSRAHTPQV
jgi:hypothetical protein